jgi:hypothetical protein
MIDEYVDELEAEVKTLRAKVEELERQQPKPIYPNPCNRGPREGSRMCSCGCGYKYLPGECRYGDEHGP